MLEGIQVLGRAELELSLQQASDDEEAFLRTLVKTDEATRYEGLIHMRLIPDNGDWRLQADLQEIDPGILSEALWLGHAPRNLPQDRATVSKLEYLISQVLPALSGNIAAGLQSPLLRDQLEGVLDAIALEFPTSGKGSGQRYRWVWNLPELGWAHWEWVSKGRRKELKALAQAEDMEAPTARLFQDHARQHGARRTIALMAAMLQMGFQAQLGLGKRGHYLYTLHIDGRWLPRDSSYHHYLYQHYLGSLFENARPGTCYLCGQHREKVTDNTTRLWLKFYITDKPGFASGFRKENFYRNYCLCSGCYKVLLAGENFMRTRLRSWLGTQVYVVPVFYLPHVQPNGSDLETWAEYVTKRWQASLTLEGWNAFRKKLHAYRRFEERKASFLLDFLFVEGDDRSIKLQHYIRDVPPSRLDELDEARQRNRAWAEKLLAPVNTWDLGFSELFYLFPIQIRREQGGKTRIVRLHPFFQFLEALLTKRSVSFRNLIPLLLETATVHRFQKYNAYVHSRPKDPDFTLGVFMAQTQLLHYILLQLNMLIPSGGASMTEAKFVEEVRQLVSSDIWDYMETIQLDLAERALFLLGVLMGEVALKQQQTGSTPILNKIHFQGMDANKVRRLSNEMMDQLRIYRALNTRTRDLFSATRVLMDQTGSFLSPAENTYWVLSGYAFRHLQRFGRGKSDSSGDKTQE